MDNTRRAADPKDALIAYDILVHVLMGVYVWEWFISLNFDWQYITRQKKFHWPMIPYFLNRYAMLFSMIGVVIGVDVTSRVNCQPLYTYDIVLGASAIGLASINLSIRTMAVWAMRSYVVIPLVVIILGHFAILLHSVVTLKATWVTGVGCVITFADDPMLMAAFIYTMIFDFIILSLMAVKLIKTTIGSPSRLRTLIFKDGLIYFLIVFLANTVATIVISLNLSPVTSVIANVPAAILSSIVACRVVRRLNNFSHSTPHTFAMPTHCSSLAFRSRGGHKFSTVVPGDGIQVQVETFPGPASEGKEAFKFATCQMGRDDHHYDPSDTQIIHGPPKISPSP